MSELIRQIQMAQRDAGERAAIAHLHASLKTQEPRTYVDDAGEEKRDRRRKDRDDDDPRIDHLFNGFDNMIQNADEYSAGYLKAMRQEFGQLIAALVR